MKPEPRPRPGAAAGGPPSKKRRKKSARGSETCAWVLTLTTAGRAALARSTQSWNAGWSGPSFGAFVQNSAAAQRGGWTSTRIETMPPSTRSPTTRPTATIQVRRWVTALILPEFLAPHRLAAGAARVAESAAPSGSDPGAARRLGAAAGLRPSEERPMPHETITLDVAQGIATITLNRPEAYNALSLTLARELFGAVLEVDEDPAVRCIVITGAGKGLLRRRGRQGFHAEPAAHRRPPQGADDLHPRHGLAAGPDAEAGDHRRQRRGRRRRARRSRWRATS